MFCHVFIGVGDFERALAFYAPLTAALGLEARFCDQSRPLLLIGAPHGGSGDGAPGLRPDYHADYYGAYVRDPDGNKLCVVCHDAE